MLIAIDIVSFHSIVYFLNPIRNVHHQRLQFLSCETLKMPSNLDHLSWLLMYHYSGQAPSCRRRHLPSLSITLLWRGTLLSVVEYSSCCAKPPLTQTPLP